MYRSKLILLLKLLRPSALLHFVKLKYCIVLNHESSIKLSEFVTISVTNDAAYLIFNIILI